MADKYPSKRRRWGFVRAAKNAKGATNQIQDELDEKLLLLQKQLTEQNAQITQLFGGGPVAAPG